MVSLANFAFLLFPFDFCLLMTLCRGVRLEGEQRSIEVDGQSEVSQEVAAEDATLLEARGLIDRTEIQNQRPKVGLLKSGHSAFANEKHLYIFGDAGRAYDAGGLVLDYLIAEVQPLDCCG